MIRNGRFVSIPKWIYAPVFFSLVCLFFEEAHSQMRFGARIGATASSLAYDPEPESQLPPEIDGNIDLNTRYGFGAGPIFLYTVSDRIDIQVELLYQQKGNKSDGNLRFSEVIFDENISIEVVLEQENKFDYFSIPVLGRYNFGSEEAAIRPFVSAGFEYGMLLGAESEVKSTVTQTFIFFNRTTTVTVPFDTTLDVEDEVKSNDFALDIGAGMEFKMGKKNLLLEFRYSLGLPDINDSPMEIADIFDEDEETPPVIKTRSIRIMLGIIF